MKTFTKNGALAVVLLLIVSLFTACNVEQTSFSIDDIEGRVKIIGKLSYSEGQTYVNGAFRENIKYPEGRKVFVEVSNVSLSPTGTGSGYTVYETKTDADGNYEIEIPAIARNSYYNTSFSVKVEDFTGTYAVLKDMENGKPVFEQKQVEFSCKSKEYSAKPNDVVIADMRYGFKERDIETGMEEVSTLRLKIGVGKLKRHEYYYYELEPYFDNKIGINALVNVTYYKEDGFYHEKDYERTYGATTNSYGEILLDIPTRNRRCELGIKVEIIPFEENNFEFPYYNDETYYYSGLYQMYENQSFITSKNYGILQFEGSDDSPTIIEAKMVFNPYDEQNSRYYYYQFNWDNTPLNY